VLVTALTHAQGQTPSMFAEPTHRTERGGFDLFRSLGTP
jgi:hypothetical protein